MDEIAKDNDFEEVLEQVIQGILAFGDGTFKISINEVNQYLILEFYEAHSSVLLLKETTRKYYFRPLTAKVIFNEYLSNSFKSDKM